MPRLAPHHQHSDGPVHVLCRGFMISSLPSRSGPADYTWRGAWLETCSMHPPSGCKKILRKNDCQLHYKKFSLAVLGCVLAGGASRQPPLGCGPSPAVPKDKEFIVPVFVNLDLLNGPSVTGNVVFDACLVNVSMVWENLQTLACRNSLLQLLRLE